MIRGFGPKRGGMVKKGFGPQEGRGKREERSEKREERDKHDQDERVKGRNGSVQSEAGWYRQCLVPDGPVQNEAALYRKGLDPKRARRDGTENAWSLRGKREESRAKREEGSEKRETITIKMRGSKDEL